MSKKKDTTEDTSLSKPAPAAPLAAPGSMPAGLLDDDTEVLAIPVAQLLQAMSPAVRDRHEGAGEGVLWNPQSQSALPDRFVPLWFTREAIKWRPREDGGGIEARSQDLKDPIVREGLEWGQDGTPPPWTLHLNCVVLFEGQSGPVILSWSKTGYGEGKNFYSLCRFAGTSNLYDRAYKWVAQERRKDQNRWFVLSVKPAGEPDEALRGTAAALSRLVGAGRVRAEHVAGQEEE